MRTKLTRLILSRWTISSLFILPLVVPSLWTPALLGQAGVSELKVLKTGLGLGTITASDPRINCGPNCEASYTGIASVTLTAAATPGTNSEFLGWSGDCSGMTCTIAIKGSRSVIANFGLITPLNPLTTVTPTAIRDYLDNPNNAQVNTPARFISVLPEDYRQNWILMSRSESLQTGTAQSPRILLPSADAENVLTIGMTEHSSYPGSHPNAIEYMEWDASQKNFRFHEIILDHIDAMGDVLPNGTRRFPERNRQISVDDEKCSKCHSTQNVLNLDRAAVSPTPGRYPGTDGVPPGTLASVTKNKPNWDAYDSWAGMLPFNRDRIYQGSIEAVAFKSLFNLWNWRNNDAVRQIIEQLELQPPHVAGSVHDITRSLYSTTDDLHIRFGFDSFSPLPRPVTTVGYSFDRPAESATEVAQGGRYVTLRHSAPMPSPTPNTFNDDYLNPGDDEGRGVQLFDLLGGLDGLLNQTRIADELIKHRFATGSFGPIDVRPIVLAISNGGCLHIDEVTDTVISNPDPALSLPPLDPRLTAFLDARNGSRIGQVLVDTMRQHQSLPKTTRAIPATRSTNLPRRKADLQKFNLDRTGDPYLFPPPTPSPATTENGLIQQYGGAAADTSVNRLRQEIFRRPIDLGIPDLTAMKGVYVDREAYYFNTDKVALFRYFLEPLGVSVDKWSMGVRGRSRTYTFADVFSTYTEVFESEIRASLSTKPVAGLTDTSSCTQIIMAVNSTLSRLPAPDAIPNFTDIQRIFNKSCIECHGGLGYPPYGINSLDLSEDERPSPKLPDTMSKRLFRSYESALSYAGPDTSSSYLYDLITDTHEDCSPPTAIGMMPCGGPALSKTDIETIRRWIDARGEPSRTAGDPHIKTVNGVRYDFQSAGEFVLLRDEYLEVQTRQMPLTTERPLAPNAHTGLSSCASINSAVAVRMGQHRITYQQSLSGNADPLELRIDGKLTKMTGPEILLPLGGRIIRTPAAGGIQIEGGGGTTVTINAGWLSNYRVWQLDIDISRARATHGVMGAVAPGDWLPALPDGTSLGLRPGDLSERYVQLYEKFEDAWRVDDTTSLFDYSPGTSTATFTDRSWPVESPKSCIAPPPPVGPAPQPPPTPLSAEAAKKYCEAIMDHERREDCVQDVMITGDPGFAHTSLVSEQIERNAPPTSPVLYFPMNNQLNLPKTITFAWNTATDANGDPVSYRLCVWRSGDKITFKDCQASQVEAIGKERGGLFALMILPLVGLPLAIFAFLYKSKRMGVTFLALILGGAYAMAFFGGPPNTSASLVFRTTTLESGKTYLWKVMAEDGKGGKTESKTWRFTTE